MKRYFQISCHVLIVSAFLALAATGQLDAPSIIIFTVGVAGSVYRTIKGRPALISARAAFYLSCSYIAFFLFDSAVLSRSFIPATIHLVLFLELAKLYQDKSDRDYFYLIVLAFLKVLAASSLTIDISFVLTFLMFLVALVSTLMSFDMYRNERKTGVATADAAVPLSGMSMWATFWIIVMGAGLFLIIPRIGTEYFTRAVSPSLLLSGFTEAVQLGEIGNVKLSSAVVMHAKRVSGPAFDTLKWRGISLDHFDGVAWRKSDRKRTQVLPSQENYFFIKPVQKAGDELHYQVLLEPLATTALFAPYQVRMVSGRLQGLDMDGDDSIYTRFQSLRRVQYEVVSESPFKNRLTEQFATNAPIPRNIAEKYLQLPDDLDEGVRRLAETITAPASTSMEKATLVDAYLKRNYRYSLTLDWQPGPQPVTTFLLSAKSGHCEYFASSMAILLRTVGIPTRIVNGFLMGEYNPVGDDYIVRQSDAHSWVEVYIPGAGWMEFDPTPPDTNRPDFTFGTQMAHYVDAAEMFWNSYLLVYDTGAQTQLFRSAQEEIQTAQNDVRTRTDRWQTRVQTIVDAIASTIRAGVDRPAVWLLGICMAFAFQVHKHRQFLQTEFRIWQLRQGSGIVDGGIIEEMFYRAAALAQEKIEERPAAQTWREWALSLSDPRKRSHISRALAVFERSRYGGQPPSADDFKLLERTIRELRDT